MTWRNLFRKHTTDDPAHAPHPQSDHEIEGSPGAQGRIPPHLQQAIDRRTGSTPELAPAERRLAALRRQRQAILFDIEQGELAASPDNPWTQRIALLSDALVTVTDDLDAAKQVARGPWHPVPALPIRIEQVEGGDAAAVALTVGKARFSWSEDQDWAERGHQMIRSELVRREGDPAALVAGDTPDGLRQALASHLEDSLFVFASDLRDRVDDGEALPESVTLADLARPCPTCGGWTDWRGTCQACARRNVAIAALRREEHRLLDERTTEADERHKLVEGLPLARKRLRDVEADLTRLGERIP